MSTNKVSYTETICDFHLETDSWLVGDYRTGCQGSTQQPIEDRWFAVEKGKDIRMHACKNCGHILHYHLKNLGIEHKFDCYEYADKPKLGLIELKE